MKMNYLTLVLLGGLLAVPVQAKILLSEVLYDAPNNDNTEEFVELYK